MSTGAESSVGSATTSMASRSKSHCIPPTRGWRSPRRKRIEYELSLGDLQMASQLPLVPVLEAFCKHLESTRTFKSFKNDFSRLRAFFGPICQSLESCPPGVKRGRQTKKVAKDKYAGAHVQVGFLEDISPEVINRFLADRIKHDNWAPKTVNLMRQILHKFFAYAIKHHGFRARDRRYPNPVTGVDRLREPAPQIRFLSLAEIETQLAAVAESPVVHAMVAMYIYAGLRREEALWLTSDDVDLKARLIRVRAKSIANESWHSSGEFKCRMSLGTATDAGVQRKCHSERPGKRFVHGLAIATAPSLTPSWAVRAGLGSNRGLLLVRVSSDSPTGIAGTCGGNRQERVIDLVGCCRYNDLGWFCGWLEGGRMDGAESQTDGHALDDAGGVDQLASAGCGRENPRVPGSPG